MTRLGRATTSVRLPGALVVGLASFVIGAAAFARVAGGIEPPTSGPLPQVPAADDGASNQPGNLTVLPLPPLEARLKAVEDQLQRVLEDDEQSKTTATSRPLLQLGGQVQIDYLFIGQDTANRATVGEAQDTFDFRRARLTARGEAYDVIEYSLGFDFALAGRPTFLDNWIAVRELPGIGNFRVGHFFEPFSLERFTVNRNNTFMERSLVDTFAPARNLGMMAHDSVGDEERGTWAVGWFRANSNNFGDDFGSVGGWAVTTRATWLPYYDEASGGRSFLHVGAAFTYRSEDQRQVQFQSFPEARAGTPGPIGIPPFVDTGIISALSDQRLGTEFALVHGPLYLQGEYVCSWVDQIGGPPLFFQGAYGFVSYFLTGESRTYNKKLGIPDRVYPFENFFRVRTDEGVQTGIGAWEIAARLSFIDLTNHNIQGGALTDVTLGLNWHLSPYTRVRWEYIHAHLNRAPVGPSMAQIAGMRFDVDF